MRQQGYAILTLDIQWRNNTHVSVVWCIRCLNMKWIRRHRLITFHKVSVTVQMQSVVLCLYFESNKRPYFKKEYEGSMSASNCCTIDDSVISSRPFHSKIIILSCAGISDFAFCLHNIVLYDCVIDDTAICTASRIGFYFKQIWLC